MVYIAIEGISGSGKSTIASYLGFLIPKGTPKFFLKECCTDKFSADITEIMIDHWPSLDDHTKFFLILTLKNHTNNNTRHFFKNEKAVVIGDRSPISTFILHKKFFEDEKNDPFIKIYKNFLKPVIPNIIIFLDTDKAIGKRDRTNNFLHDQEEIYNNYITFFEKSKIKVIKVKPKLTAKLTVDSFVDDLNESLKGLSDIKFD